MITTLCAYRAGLWDAYEFRQIFEGLDRNAQGYPEHRHRETRIVFMSLSGGRGLRPFSI